MTTIEALEERVEGCQEREKAERDRVHARLSDLEGVTRKMADDLTFLRGRITGWWGFMIFIAGCGGIAGAIAAVISAVKGG